MKRWMKFVICLVTACAPVIPASGQDVISTVIGGGPNNLPAVNANLYVPEEVAVDTAGNVYVVASYQHQIYKISTAGTLTVVAGNGFPGYSGDGDAAVNAELYYPAGLAVDSANPANVYIADTYNCLVRKVDQATGIITTVAGLVTSSTATSCGYSGDGGKADAAEIYYPEGLSINPATSDLYITDYQDGVIRKVLAGSASGTISTVAGSKTEGNCTGKAPYGDGGAATSASLCYPNAVTVDNSVSPANLFISQSNAGNVCAVREVVGATGKIYLVAGSYSLGCGLTDKVNALDARLDNPWQMHVSVSESTSTIEVADFSNNAIRQFTLTYSSDVPKPGTITTIAGGNGESCGGDGGAAVKACLQPIGLAYDASGDYYIGDYGDNRVRKVLKSTADISTIAGWGPAYGGQPYYSDPVGLIDEKASASLYSPIGVFADPASTKVYVGGFDGQAVYVWNSSTNEISNFAGSGVAGFAGDDDAATSSETKLKNPTGIGKDSYGNVYIADSLNCVIRKVSESNGDITTVTGGRPGVANGCGYLNGYVTTAKFNSPSSVAFDAENNMYIADTDNCAIRKLTASTDAVSTIAGAPATAPVCGYSGDGGPAVDAQIYFPQQLALDSAGNIYFADNNNHRIREIVAGTGTILTIAGNDATAYSGDGPAVDESLYYPVGIFSDPSGNLFLADSYHQLLRWITPTGELITFAGSETKGAGFSGDGGPALDAQFFYPQFISRDSTGNTYVADYDNERIRRISAFAGYGLSTASVAFPTQPVGALSNFEPVIVSGVGPTTISAVAVTNGFSEIDDCVGQPLNANETCQIDVYFQPTNGGKTYGSLTLTSNALFSTENPHIVALSGTAEGLALNGSLAFGTELLKSTTTKTATLKNDGAAITLSKIYLTEADGFSIVTGAGGSTCPTTGGAIAANASCTVVVRFIPTVSGLAKSTLVVDSTDPGGPLLAQASGTGTAVTVSASSIAFGTISYGTTSTVYLTIKNVGTSAFTLTPSIAGAGFSISATGKTCSTSLAAGASCVLPVEYDPTAVGSNTGTLTVTTNGGSSPALSLSGAATADVSVSPTSLAFGTITHGTTKTLDLTITNVGKIALLKVSAAISGTDAADFVVLTTGDTCTSGVAPGKSCTLPVEFKPAAADAYSATLTLTTNGGTNPTVALTGTGH